MPAEPNPYEPPRSTEESTLSFRDDQSEVAELRRRVEELEKRLINNWMVSPSRLRRMFGVLGYFFLGYGLLCVIIYAVFGLVTLTFYLLGR
jgi:hypothetical protein